MNRLFLSSIPSKITYLGLVTALLCLAAALGSCAASTALGQVEQEDVSTEILDVAAASDEGVQVVSAFAAGTGELPEGLAIDKSGSLYVSLGYPFWFPVEQGFGEIRKITPNGESTALHTFPDGPGPAGLALTPSGELYFAYPNPMDPGTNGVYRLKGEGDPERLPGSENIILANGLALTPSNLYVSDSAFGAVWRIPRGGTAENWLQHDWLTGCNPDTDPVGANGIAVWKNSLYVASTARGLLVRVPILPDGAAGEPEIIAGDNECDPEFDQLDGIDGIALDVHGNVFALLVMQHKLVRIDAYDGTLTVLLTGEDGLFNPASISFGTGSGGRQYVFMSNFALLGPGPENNLGPSVLKYDVGVPGMPLP